jgi:hypothetical protein
MQLGGAMLYKNLEKERIARVIKFELSIFFFISAITESDS